MKLYKSEVLLFLMFFHFAEFENGDFNLNFLKIKRSFEYETA